MIHLIWAFQSSSNEPETPNDEMLIIIKPHVQKKNTRKSTRSIPFSPSSEPRQLRQPSGRWKPLVSPAGRG